MKTFTRPGENIFSLPYSQKGETAGRKLAAYIWNLNKEGKLKTIHGGKWHGTVEPATTRFFELTQSILRICQFWNIETFKQLLNQKAPSESAQFLKGMDLICLPVEISDDDLRNMMEIGKEFIQDVIETNHADENNMNVIVRALLQKSSMWMSNPHILVYIDKVTRSLKTTDTAQGLKTKKFLHLFFPGTESFDRDELRKSFMQTFKRLVTRDFLDNFFKPQECSYLRFDSEKGEFKSINMEKVERDLLKRFPKLRNTGNIAGRFGLKKKETDWLARFNQIRNSPKAPPNPQEDEFYNQLANLRSRWATAEIFVDAKNN